MGFSGTFLVCRTDVEFYDIDLINERSEGVEWTAKFREGWRVGQYLGNDLEADIVSLTTELAEFTGSPVMSGFVIDSDCAFITGYSGGGTWRACLDRRGSSSLLREYGDSIDEKFPSATEASELALTWAQEAGTTADQAQVRKLFKDGRSDPDAEDLFFSMLNALGIRKVEHA